MHDASLELSANSVEEDCRKSPVACVCLVSGPRVPYMYTLWSPGQAVGFQIGVVDFPCKKYFEA